MKLIDIGANLTDLMFQGKYNGSDKQYHEADLNLVLERAWSNHMEKIIITSGRLNETIESIELIKNNSSVNNDNKLFTTIGIHPTRCSQELIIKDSNNDNNQELIIDQEYFKKLINLYNENSDKIIAIGEFGLDYDRLEFCSKEIQIKCFKLQFENLVLPLKDKQLPLFLHLRGNVESNVCNDFIEILKLNKSLFKYAVVHSFTGTEDELNRLLEFDNDLFIGINGCSLKTDDNLKVVSKIPLNRLLIETDSPYCDIRKTSAAYKYVKTIFPTFKRDKFKLGSCIQNRNEPCNIINVLEVIVGLHCGDNKDLTNYNNKMNEISEIIYNNTIKVFFSNK